MKMHLAVAAAGVFTSFVVVACSSNPQPNTANGNMQGGYGQPNNGYGQPNNGYGQPNGAYPNNGQPNGAYPNNGQPNGAYPANTAGGYPPPAGNTAAPPATAAPPPAATGGGNNPGLAVALQPLLLPLQQQQAPGAQAASDTVGGMLQEGQSAQVTVQLAPSGTKCYTAVAVGAPTVSAILLELIATPPAPLPPTTLAQSQPAPLQTVMAGKPNCYKNLLPVPVPAILKITAQHGTGPVLGQLYAKLKERHRRSSRESPTAAEPTRASRLALVARVVATGAHVGR